MTSSHVFLTPPFHSINPLKARTEVYGNVHWELMSWKTWEGNFPNNQLIPNLTLKAMVS